MDRETILCAAWKALAHNPKLDNGFPRGFWPDLAAVAVEMALQGTLDPQLDFRPTRSGDIFLHINKKPKKKLSAAVVDQERQRAIMEEDDDDNPFAKMQKRGRSRDG